ncbi:MAG: UDP-N-acetylmuramoyl-tripeptide--D-alanyl-D-alanine ligase [Smithellaceae bacterium]|nr:UDP-N-acetylmuramoyl-tripeptide--D-alanyl-D-alanine ligase [Smithellaceae bacterium]
MKANLTVADIISATGGTLVRGSTGEHFSGIWTDSRKPFPGGLFIPLIGERFDGHQYLEDVLQAGAAGVLIQEDRKTLIDRLPPGVVIIVTNTLTALGDIAHGWRKRWSIPVVAITGSAGKTTTKEMIVAILSQSRRVLKTEGNLNNLVGLPLTLMGLDGTHEAAVLEMGTNTPGEIGRLAEIASPDIGIITNIGYAHLEGLKTLDAIRDEKGALLEHLGSKGIAVLNRDDEQIRILENRFAGRKITYAVESEADVTAGAISTSPSLTTCFTLVTPRGEADVTIPAVGRHSVSDALGAAAVALAMGVEKEDIVSGLSSFASVSGRQQIYRLANGSFVIDDSYNANPASVRAALRTLKDLRGNHGATVILGDMLELGDRSWELHEEVGEIIAESSVGMLFLRGEFAQATTSGARRKGLADDAILIDCPAAEIVSRLRNQLRPGDWVLVKGSRRMKMEEIVQAIITGIGLASNENDIAGPGMNTRQQ